MTELLDAGFEDTFRVLYPDKTDCYTWWSYFANSRERNIGWRIDYFIISKDLKKNLKEAYIFDKILGSDHCPVGIDIEAIIVVYKLLDNFGEITVWVKNLISILMPFIMAVILAYLFYLPCRRVEGIFNKSKAKLVKKRARWLAIFTVYIIAIIIVIIVIKFIVPTVYESLTELITALPGYYKSAIETIDNLPEDTKLRRYKFNRLLKLRNDRRICKRNNRSCNNNI